MMSSASPFCKGLLSFFLWVLILCWHTWLQRYDMAIHMGSVAVREAAKVLHMVHMIIRMMVDGQCSTYNMAMVRT